MERSALIDSECSYLSVHRLIGGLYQPTINIRSGMFGYAVKGDTYQRNIDISVTNMDNTKIPKE